MIATIRIARCIAHAAAFLALVLIPPTVPLDGARAQTTPARLKIATRIVPPLVIRDDAGRLSGFSIDLWTAVAERAKLPFDFVVKETLPDLIAAVRSGEADAAVAAISITSEREAEFDFSQPILDSGLQILVREPGQDAGAGKSLLTLLKSPQLYELLGILLLLALLPVPIVWLAERRHGAGIVEPGSKRGGLAKTLFWSLATLGGQAEEMPASFVGRIVAVLTIFVSVLFVSYFTATTTTILTVRELTNAIRGPGDLPGQTVATVAGSTAASYLSAQGIRTILVPRIEDAVSELESGAADAVVYDSPVLLYRGSHAGHGKVRVVGPVFRKEGYGVLLPAGSRLRKPINAGLLALQESGAYRAVHADWFGQE